MIGSLKQTLQLIINPTRFLEDCAAKNGDPFTVRVLEINSPPVVFFGSPEAIAECFAVPAKDLDFKKATHVFEPLFGENSIVLQEGRCLGTSRSASVHNRQRQLLMPPFHGDVSRQDPSGLRMKTYGQVICQITENIIQNWTPGKSISVQHVMPDITLQIILQVVFGISPGVRYPDREYRAKHGVISNKDSI